MASSATLEEPASDDDETFGTDALAESAAPAETATVRARTSRVSQAVTVLAVVVPLGGVFSAAGLFWGVAFTPLDAVLFGAFYLATALGITVGYHRLFTHRAFVAPTAVRASLAVLGAMTLQGPITQWVTDHRKHHARSDQPGDPHSPHLAGPGRFASLRGLWHAHLGWMFSTKGMERGARYGADLYADPLIRRIDRLYLVWVAASVGLPFVIAYAATGSTRRGLEALVWAGLVRIFVFEHATFAVNSICHSIGSRRYEVGDESRNNVVVALLTLGEGWHNNHHAFPRSARQGLTWNEPDVSYGAIRLLALLKLARDLRLPSPAQLARAASR